MNKQILEVNSTEPLINRSCISYIIAWRPYALRMMLDVITLALDMAATGVHRVFPGLNPVRYCTHFTPWRRETTVDKMPCLRTLRTRQKFEPQTFCLRVKWMKPSCSLITMLQERQNTISINNSLVSAWKSRRPSKTDCLALLCLGTGPAQNDNQNYELQPVKLK